MFAQGVHLELVEVDQVILLAGSELLHQHLVVSRGDLLPGDVQTGCLLHGLFEQLVLRVILSAGYSGQHLDLHRAFVNLTLGEQREADGQQHHQNYQYASTFHMHPPFGFMVRNIVCLLASEESYSFTEPIIIPLEKNDWVKKYRTTKGRAVMTTAAIFALAKM